MNSIVLTSSSITNIPTNNHINQGGDTPSSEKVKHTFERSGHHFLLQQGLPLTQRNITFNTATREKGFSKENLSQAPLFINDFLSMSPDKLNLDPNEIVAFFNGDIDQDKFIEINTKSKLIAETFIKKFTPELHFQSGTIVTHDDFLEDSLFKDAEEKNVVFIRLFFLINSPNFTEGYNTFLSNLQNNSWHKAYSEKPEELALFSILAFYDGVINRDELFTLNMASSALKEIKSPDSHIKEVKFRVVADNEIAAYLEESGFPPFAANTKEYIISNHSRKQGAELEEAITKFLSKYRKRRTIGKTFIEYTLKDFFYDKKNLGAIEAGIYYSAKSKVGFKNVIDGKEGTVVLAPPELIIYFYYAASCVTSDLVPQHHFMFGFSEDPGPLYEEIRPISIASALFRLPLVHNYPAGPSLGVTTHDLNFHMLLEAINPYIGFFIDLASELKTQAEQNYLNKNKWLFTWCERICNLIIDREVNEYREERIHRNDSDFYGSASWGFIIYKVLKKAKIKLTNKLFLYLLEDLLYPIIQNVTHKYGFLCISLDDFKEKLAEIEEERTLKKNKSKK